MGDSMVSGARSKRASTHAHGTFTNGADFGRYILLAFALMFVFMGCQTLPYFPVDSEPAKPSADDVGRAKEGEPTPAKASSPAPRTFPQAVRAYVNKLHAPREDGAK